MNNKKQEYFKRVINYFGSQTRLAEELGVSRQMISIWYKGKQNMPILYAVKIEFITGGKFKFTKLLNEEAECYLKNT